MIRYVLMLGLLLAAVVVPSRLANSATLQRLAPDPDVPEAVHEAIRQGRYWRASRVLGEYLAAAPDTTPRTILLASRVSAGWGNWSTVNRLLEGRQWLDQIENGAGWLLLGRSHIELGRAEAGTEALARYLRVGGNGDRERGLAEIRRGLALQAAGRTAEALAALDSAAALVPWFGDWIHFFAAETASAAGDTAEVARRLAASETELARDRGWRLRLDAARRAGAMQTARRLALEAAQSAAPAERRAAAWSTLADLRLQAGDSARAREAYRNAMEAAPGTTAAVDGARGLSRMKPTPAEWRSIADVYGRHGNQTRAIEGYQAYLASGAGSPADRAQVRLQLGRAYFAAGQYRDAEQRLLALANDSVPARVAAEALYQAGRAQYRQGRSADGQATFLAVSRRFPDQEATTRALYLLADLKHDDLELADARRYYRQAADAAPDVNEAGLALMRLGGLAFLAGDYDGAAEVYEQYRTRHPSGRRITQATYWAGRAHQAAGRTARADTLFRQVRAAEPLSYYGMRAAELLGARVLDIPMDTSPPHDPTIDSLVATGLRRVDMLEALGRRTELVAEVEQLRRHFGHRDGGDYALAEALNQRGYTLTGLSMGWEIRRAEPAWNLRLLRIIYPFPFQELVVPESRERGLDPYLVAGLIRRESAFNPSVTSSAGAIGLMQIMPQTGRGLASGAGIRPFDLEMLKQPELNVHLGVRYLAQLMRQFDGDLPLVLSAYNAGPNRAVRWRQMPELRDPELFAERIPYNETRDYVRFVLLHRALYEGLYPGLAAEAG